MKKAKEPKDLGLEIYNDAQRWWVNVKDNCETTIKQFEDSIKLQKEIRNLAEIRIKENKDKS